MCIFSIFSRFRKIADCSREIVTSAAEQCVIESDETFVTIAKKINWRLAVDRHGESLCVNMLEDDG